jgi:two-component system, chemotaxis family, CheB/CheR fusion protein
LRIKRYTASAQALINLIESDVNRPLTHITHMLEYDQLIPDVRQVLTTATPIERELESRQQRWYLMRIQPYRNETDQVDGIVLTFVDITQRRKTEEALRTSEERLRLLIENVVDYAILTITAAYGIAYWNSGAERMFGYSEAEILGQSAEQLFTPEDQEAGIPMQELQQALAEGQVEGARWYIRKDGSRLYASGLTTRMRNPYINEFAMVLRDLTP